MNLMDSIRAKADLVYAMRMRNRRREVAQPEPGLTQRQASSISGPERRRRNRRRAQQTASRRANRGR